MTSNDFNPHDSLVFLTIRVGKLLANRIRTSGNVHAHGLQPHHMGILVDLWTLDGVCQQDLAIASIRDKASITRALDQLEKQDVLVRVPDDRDRRINRIYLTRKGKVLKSRLLPLADAVVAQAIEGVAGDRVETCKEVLRKMYENLNI